MSFQNLPNINYLKPFGVSILICSSIALTACGGGGGSSESTTSPTGSTTSPTGSTTSPTGSTTSTTGSTTSPTGSTTSPTGSTTSTTGSTTSTTGSTTSTTGSTTSTTGSTTSTTGSTTSTTGSTTPTTSVVTELADTATLPQPPANSSALSLTQDAVAQSDLITGAYKYSQGYVTSLGMATNDCPTSQSAITCPMFTRIRVDAAGNVTNDSYAYYPIQKIWVKLLGSSNFSLPSGDLFNGGGAWKTSGLNLTTASLSSNGQWVFNFDNVQFKLFASSSTLASTTIPNSTQVYSANARALSVGLEQMAGSYYILKVGGFWSTSSDDKNSYSNLASFVAAHTNVNTPYCLANVSDEDLVIFNLISQSVNLYSVVGICGNITTQSPVQLSEGVTTVAGRKVMVMSLPTQSTTNTSGVQYNLAVALNDTGVAENGKVFQTGYAQQLTGYVNQAAFLDWIDVNHSEVTAASLPQ